MIDRLILCCIGAVLALASAPAAERKPNVVMILTDDQGWGDLAPPRQLQPSHAAHRFASLRAGARVDRFFVRLSARRRVLSFSPAATIARTGVRGVSTGQERMNLDEKTLADTLQAAGYATGAFGKWHNGSQWPYHPNARGFDEYYGFTSGHWGEYFNPPLEHNGELVRRKATSRTIFTDRALHSSISTVRSHFSVMSHSILRIRRGRCRRAIGSGLRIIRSQLRGSEKNDRDLAETRCALAMCENLDDNIGRLLAKLQELKLAENTIVDLLLLITDQMARVGTVE